MLRRIQERERRRVMQILHAVLFMTIYAVAFRWAAFDLAEDGRYDTAQHENYGNEATILHNICR